jgi:hypothetical protein
MLFQKKLGLYHLGLEVGQRLEFSTDLPAPMRIEIEQCEADRDDEFLPFICPCIVETDEPVPPDVIEQFQKIWAEERTPGLGNASVPSQEPPVPPQSVRETVDRINDRTKAFVRRVVRLYCWRRGFPGKHDPIRYDGATKWSLDGSDWKHTPIGCFSGRHRSWWYLNLDEDLLNGVRTLLARGLEAPLARELFLEAWGARFSNRRSSLLIGMAAAEIGVKSFLAKLVPDAQWLLFELPSPPMDKFLRKYFPILLADGRCPDEARFPLTKKMLGRLSKAVELRNEVTHSPDEHSEEKLSEEKLVETLETVSDLLYLLDVYLGEAWGAQLLSQRYKTEVANMHV